MSHPLALPTGPYASAHTALVALLHRRDGAEIALGLVQAWGPAVPGAIISTLLVADSGGFDEASGQLARRLEQAGLDGARLVLAGIGGAGATALQLAYGRNAVGCSGVLACVDILPPLEPPAERASGTGTRLRLVWTADEAQFCAAALGDLLRCFRAAGIDAQGAVLAPRDRRSREACSSPDPSPVLVRRGGAYLAELVAVALGAASRPRPASMQVADMKR